MSNTLHHIYAIHGCKCSSKKYSIHLKIRNTVLWKKLFPAIKHSKLHRISFGGTTTLDSSLFLISCYFNKIFVHLSVIAEVCHFSVYKLIRWDPVNMQWFQMSSRNTRKGYEMCLKLTIYKQKIVLVSLSITSNTYFQ